MNTETARKLQALHMVIKDKLSLIEKLQTGTICVQVNSQMDESCSAITELPEKEVRSILIAFYKVKVDMYIDAYKKILDEEEKKECSNPE